MDIWIILLIASLIAWTIQAYIQYRRNNATRDARKQRIQKVDSTKKPNGE
jgi:hypothetical protein